MARVTLQTVTPTICIIVPASFPDKQLISILRRKARDEAAGRMPAPLWSGHPARIQAGLFDIVAYKRFSGSGRISEAGDAAAASRRRIGHWRHGKAAPTLAARNVRNGGFSGLVERAGFQVRAEQHLQGEPRQAGQIQQHLAGRKRVSGFPVAPGGGGYPEGRGDVFNRLRLLRPPPPQPRAESGAMGIEMIIRLGVHGEENGHYVATIGNPMRSPCKDIPDRKQGSGPGCPRHGGPGILPGASKQKLLPIPHPAQRGFWRWKPAFRL